MSNWCKNIVKSKPKKVSTLKQMSTWCYKNKLVVLNFICWIGLSIASVLYARTLDAKSQSGLAHAMCILGLMSVQILNKTNYLKYIPYIIAIIIIKSMTR